MWSGVVARYACGGVVLEQPVSVGTHHRDDKGACVCACACVHVCARCNLAHRGTYLWCLLLPYNCPFTILDIINAEGTYLGAGL